MEPREEISIDVTVPSCSCCGAKMEQEVSAALAVPKGTVSFSVPVRAQLRYDPKVVQLGEILNALKARGCAVPSERIEFRIPTRPTIQPAVWKEKIRGLPEKLQGIISASVSFQGSRITVDYLPGLITPTEIREAVIGWGPLHSHSAASDANGDRTTDALPIVDVSGRRAAQRECMVGDGI